MFCPKCSREQPSDDTRFCSGCGFQLSVVSGLLSTDGILPAVEISPLPPKAPLSPKKHGVRQGAKLMFLSMVMAPIAMAISIGIFDHPGFLLIPFTIFLAGIAWMVYSAIFGEDYPVAPTHRAFQQPRMNPQQLHAPPQPFAMPHQNAHHAPPPRRIETAPNLQPPSVTESTTRLLEKERRERHERQ